MTPSDLRVLCAALGFTAVVMQGGKLPKQDCARRASEFAGHIEEYCRITEPEALHKERKKICKLSI
jgi:hypothetical protein